MKTVLKARITQHATILLIIILATTSLIYAISLFPFSRSSTTIIRYIFPHEVLQITRELLFYRFRTDFIRSLPLFTIIFCIFFAFALGSFKKDNKAYLLKISFYILIVSIAISIPNIFTGYNYMLKQYNEYVPPAEGQRNGILNLIDTFGGHPRKLQSRFWYSTS